MKFGLGFAALVIGLIGVNSPKALACTTGDYICEKFKRIQAEKVAKKRRATKRRRIRRARKKTAAKPASRPATPLERTSIPPKPVRTSMMHQINVAPPTAKVERLAPGSISKAPSHVSGLVFGSEDLMETATAMCEPEGLHATRSITCALAVHRARIDIAAGDGCSTSLALKEMTFRKSPVGKWVNEESISLCGGRLLRRAELFPISVNGKQSYAISEEYRMLGGSRSCAAPYLQSRQPLKKTYMPVTTTRSLQCGKLVATR